LQIANDVTEPAAPERPHAPGSTLHLATIIEEVAGIRLTEELKATQLYARSLIESNIDALMTTDPLGVITDVNQQMEALTGSTREQLIGTPFKNCFTDPARARRTAVCRNWPCDSAFRTRRCLTVIPGMRSHRNMEANCAAPNVWQKKF
jgi:PAS domain-containing protein